MRALSKQAISITVVYSVVMAWFSLAPARLTLAYPKTDKPSQAKPLAMADEQLSHV